MATKPLTSEAIALTEKKMDMTLDDIIKMSKSRSAKPMKQRVSNKSQRFPNGVQDKSHKIRKYVDSRSTLRQNVLSQRRSNFQGKSFPLVTEAAQKAAIAPFPRRVNHNRAVNGNKPRPAGPMRRQGNNNTSDRNISHKQKQNGSHQGGRDTMGKQKPPRNTLDSLFANMKEERMRRYSLKSNGGQRRPVQPWLRGRFGNFRN